MIYGFQWQLYPSLGLKYYYLDDNPYPDIYRGIRGHVLIIGPLQMRWNTFLKPESLL